MPVELREETFYTVKEVAEKLDVHLRTVRRMLADGRLTASRLGNRIYIADSVLMELLTTPTDMSQSRLSPEGKAKMQQVAARAVVKMREKRAAKRAAKMAQGGPEKE